MPFADALPILYSHLPENLELRIKISNPVDLNGFFTQLNDKWLEAGGPTVATQAMQQFSQRNEALEKFADIAQRLGYTGNMFDPIAIHSFIENGLRQTKHVRKTYVSKALPKKLLANPLVIAQTVERQDIRKLIALKAKRLKRLILLINLSRKNLSQKMIPPVKSSHPKRKRHLTKNHEIHIV